MNCQKLTASILLIVFGVVLLVPSRASSGDMGGYMDSMLSQLQNLTPKSYEGQERGYFMGGSASVRFGFQQQPLVSFTPPSAKVGCSGIDLTMGGFSYLNFEHLVQKLQGILSAAPAFAFQAALGTLCEQCKDIVSSLEQMTNMINSLNVDSCKASAALGGWVGSQVGKSVSSSLSDGGSNSWFSELKTTMNDTANSFNKYVQSVTGDVDYWACIGQGGSEKTCSSKHGKITFTVPLMTQIFTDYSQVSQGLRDAETIFRAYYGDVYQPGADAHKAQDPNGKSIPDIKGDPGCVTDGDLITGLVEGSYYVKPRNDEESNSPNCTLVQDEQMGLNYKVKAIMKKLVENIRAGTKPSNDEIALINFSRIPIYRLIALGVLVEKIGGDQDKLLTTQFADMVSVPVAYDIAYNIVNYADTAVAKTATAVKAGKADNDPTGASPALVAGIVERIDKALASSRALVNNAWTVFESSYGRAYEREQKMQEFVYTHLQKNKLLDSYLYAKGLR